MAILKGGVDNVGKMWIKTNMFISVYEFVKRQLEN